MNNYQLAVGFSTEWQFLKLENNICYLDEERYFLDKPENILGVLQAIIDIFEEC